MATISYTLGANPVWYIANNLGLPANGAYLEAVSSLNPQMLKPVYRDAGGPDGAGPWPNVPVPNTTNTFGILFNSNGQQGPFYFTFDTADPDDLYSLFVYDNQGNLIWTTLDYDPSGGGGGSVITEVQNAQNLVINSIFWRHIPDLAAIVSTAFRIAPGAHSALAQTSSNANPDIWFLKDNLTATESLTFPNFTFGVQEFSPDQTPPDYLKFTCTAPGTLEALKCIQIPIMQNVVNFSNTEVTVTFWANNFGLADSDITLFWWQFFGDGSPATTAIPTPIETFTISTGAGWTKNSVTTTVPSVVLSPTPAVVGPCHNDGLFLRIGLPLNEACNLGITKPSMYLNAVTVKTDYQTYDQIDSVINAPRTGHLVAGFDTAIPPGYLYMNDGTIGSASSGATNFASGYAFPLYNLIWNGTNATNPAWAPVTGGRGVSAIADFSANKPMQLLYALGAIIGNTGITSNVVYGNRLTSNPWLLGQPFGDEQDTAPLPVHNHTALGGGAFIDFTIPGFGNQYPNTGQTGTPGVTTANAGTGGFHNTIQPTLRFNYFIKL